MRVTITVLIVMLVFYFVSCSTAQREIDNGSEKVEEALNDSDVIELPESEKDGGRTLNELLDERRSVRTYTDGEVSLEELSQILWAGDGINDEERGFRTSPSAGALYPIETYIFKDDGIYRYVPDGHLLKRLDDRDMRDVLFRASYQQGAVGDADIVLVLIGFVERTSVKYGDRALRYVFIEGGHICQNILLEVENLGLGAVPIGAFKDDEVLDTLSLTGEVVPIYIIPVGRIKD